MLRDELYFDIHTAIFFDVADRLKDKTYIWNQAIRIDPRHRLTSESAPTMLPPWMLPSPRRSEVAKRNRAKRRGITEEGRQRLREAAIANQPWQYSSGPKTLWGKYYSARNGKVRQKGECSVREARAELQANKELLQFMLAHPELGTGEFLSKANSELIVANRSPS